MLDINDHLREVTEDEIAHYEQYGWAKLDGLVTREFAAQLLEVALQPREGLDREIGTWEQMANLPGIEPYRSFFFSERMGRNASRLINRKKYTDEEVPLRYRLDHFIKRDPGAKGTLYHQDSAEHGSDRAGELQFWLALDEVTPEMGAMRFLSGSHRAGSLGAVLRPGEPDLLGLYPKLPEVFPMSEPFHYQPGDCTVHHGYMVHGAPPNTSDRPRMCYIFSYTPADTRWPQGITKNWGSLSQPLTNEVANPVAYPVPAANQ